MSILQSLFNAKKLENGMVWCSIFTITTLPVGLIANKLINTRLNLYPNDKEILKEQIFKMLLGISGLIGFIYGYNKSRRLLK